MLSRPTLFGNCSMNGYDLLRTSEMLRLMCCNRDSIFVLSFDLIKHSRNWRIRRHIRQMVYREWNEGSAHSDLGKHIPHRFWDHVRLSTRRLCCILVEFVPCRTENNVHLIGTATLDDSTQHSSIWFLLHKETSGIRLGRTLLHGDPLPRGCGIFIWWISMFKCTYFMR